MTKTYSLLQNRKTEDKTPILYPGLTRIGVTAGTVNIDIPFDTLSKTEISPETSLDRQIAANLRLKNIIGEYLSLKERSAQVLKGLNIPYLAKNTPLERTRPGSVPEEIKAEKTARKNMENAIVFSQAPRPAPVNRQAAESQVTGAPEKDGQKTMPAGDIASPQPSPEYPEKSSYQTTYCNNTELPWFFSFVLKLIRYAVDNKLEIFLWATALIMSGLIGIVVVKQ